MLPFTPANADVDRTNSPNSIFFIIYLLTIYYTTNKSI
jgi:hypothetical protein